MQRKEDLMKISSITKSPLFKGIKKDEIRHILGCLNSYNKTYSKGSYVWHAGDKPKNIGLILDGQVNIIKEDILGNTTVIANINSSNIFGESFAITKAKEYPVSAQVSTDSIILLLEYNRLITLCKKLCPFHKKLIDNLLTITAQKNIKLKNRINCITKKDIRQKVLYFLVDEIEINNKYEVEIPFNREELANYLGVNRSALSRILSELKKEDLIEFNKNMFKVGDINKLKKEILF